MRPQGDKYQAVCARPRQVFASAFAFAGLRAIEAILGILPGSLQKVNHKYRQQLTSAQIGTITHVQRELLEELVLEVW